MGSGGLGALYGGLQARAGIDVTFIARGGNLQALRDQGLTVRLNDDEFHLPVRATDDPAEIGPVDLVWFAVKTYDAAAAGRQIMPLVGPETMVLALQNGIGTVQLLDDVLGAGHALPAIALGGATLLSPGVVAAKGANREIRVGEPLGGTSDRIDKLRDALAGSRIEVQASQQIQVELWDKFVAACCTLGLCALTRATLAEILAHEESEALALGVMREVDAVARARGVELPDGTPERWLAYIRERTIANPEVAGSMYFDVMQGRRLELDAMNGAVSKLGRELGVPTPLNFAIYAGLLPYAYGRSEPLVQQAASQTSN